MQVGAFFEVYGINNKELNKITSSKISDFSQICELNIVDKNTCVGKNNVMMAGFKDIMIEKYLRKILKILLEVWLVFSPQEHIFILTLLV